MMLEDVGGYSIKILKDSKRAQVRKGCRSLEIHRITDVKDLMEAAFRVNLSYVARVKWGRDYANKKRWCHNVEFTFPWVESWGAYADGVLVAYISAYQVEDTMCLCSSASHSDYLSLCPNDALIFTFLDSCKGRENCKRVTFGLYCDDEPLNQFKMRLGFRRVDIPIYRYTNPVIRWAIPFTRYRHYTGFKVETNPKVNEDRGGKFL
jgi:hypothetical protein